MPKMHHRKNKKDNFNHDYSGDGFLEAMNGCAFGDTNFARNHWLWEIWNLEYQNLLFVRQSIQAMFND